MTQTTSGGMLRICTEDDPLVFRSVLDRVGDKWTLIIIGLLDERTLRFTELLGAIPGISRKMLTQSLRSLERDGLITRTSHAENPPRVEYSATDLGRTLSEPVLALAAWAARNKTEIVTNRRAYDEVAFGASADAGW